VCRAVTTLRRLGFVFWLTRARLARRGGRFLLVAVGVAAAAAMLAAVVAGALAAQDRDVAKRLSAIDEGSRSIHVTWFSVGGQAAPYSTLDRHVRGTANHRKELWTLFMFQLWAAAYCGA